jgi:hypothetical protein
VATAARVLTGAVSRLSGGTLELRYEAANMLIEQGIFTTTAIARAIFRGTPERRHRIKMNKAEIRELIALMPVYPGVDRLNGNCGEFA